MRMGWAVVVVWAGVACSFNHLGLDPGAGSGDGGESADAAANGADAPATTPDAAATTPDGDPPPDASVDAVPGCEADPIPTGGMCPTICSGGCAGNTCTINCTN